MQPISALKERRLPRQKVYPAATGRMRGRSSSSLSTGHQGTRESVSATEDGHKVKQSYTTVTEYLAQASADLTALYESLDAFLIALGDDAVMKTNRYWFQRSELRLSKRNAQRADRLRAEPRFQG